MKRITYISLLSLLLVSGTINAQFAKPLNQSPQGSLSEADYNIGIIGGISATRWFFQGDTYPAFEQPYVMFTNEPISANLLNNALFGLSFEYRLGSNTAIGLEAVYANRSTALGNQYERAENFNETHIHYWSNSINYKEMYFQVPLTLYLTRETASIRPYVFVGPRLTIPIAGTMKTTDEQCSTGSLFHPETHEIPEGSTLTTSTVSFDVKNMRPWNIGAAAGLGVLFRIPLGNYHFKAKLDASCHLGLLNTFSKYERGLVKDDDGNPILPIDQNENTIDPDLIGQRYIGNATVKLTLLFPLKKITKGACVNWGEYD